MSPLIALRFAMKLLAAAFCFFIPVVKTITNFTKCYNTATQMHCFSETLNRGDNFSEAERHCSAMNAKLPVIKDETVEEKLKDFIQYYLLNGSISEGDVTNFWTSARRINNHTWSWLDSTLNPVPASNINNNFSTIIHVASIQLILHNGSQLNVTLNANNPATNMSYICEYVGGRCQHLNGSILRYSNKCYVAYEENTTWYDARNRCLNLGGDLASFEDISSINFTQLMAPASGNQHWIGLRWNWWIWKTSGKPTSEVRYTNWNRLYPSGLLENETDCVVICRNCVEPYDWNSEYCSAQKPTTWTVCHKVSGLDSTSSPSASVPSIAEASSIIPLAVGIGVGVGVPVVVALIIIVVVVAVKQKRKRRQKGAVLTTGLGEHVLNNIQTDPLETKKEDNAKDRKYWNPVKSDSTSAASEDDQIITSQAPNSSSCGNIVYSGVEIVEEKDQNEREDTKGGVYWNPVKTDSASAASEDDGIIASPAASNSNSNGNIVYSGVEIVEEKDQND